MRNAYLREGSTGHSYGIASRSILDATSDCPFPTPTSRIRTGMLPFEEEEEMT